MRFDGQSIGCYLSNHRMSLPFRRRDGVVEMREVAPVIIATERPLGDTLALLPFAYEFRGRVTITGNFHRLVPPLCSGIEFDPEGSAHGAHYVVAPSLSAGILQERGLLLHANQVPFLQYDLPVPALPITLPLVTAHCGIEPGIVIAPFSHVADKAHQGLMVWDHARWVAVVEALRARGHTGPVYVLGAGADRGTMARLSLMRRLMAPRRLIRRKLWARLLTLPTSIGWRRFGAPTTRPLGFRARLQRGDWRMNSRR